MSFSSLLKTHQPVPHSSVPCPLRVARSPTAAAAEPIQDSRAVIDAKSAQLLVTAKVKELQQAVQDAAASNAMLVNANLIDPDVRLSALANALEC